MQSALKRIMLSGVNWSCVRDDYVQCLFKFTNTFSHLTRANKLVITTARPEICYVVLQYRKLYTMYSHCLCDGIYSLKTVANIQNHITYWSVNPRLRLHTHMHKTQILIVCMCRQNTKLKNISLEDKIIIEYKMFPAGIQL